MNFKKYMKVLVLSLVMLMVFTGCSSQKIDDGGLVADKDMDKSIDETNDDKLSDESENLDDQMMLIDIRETVSGLFDGEFPSIIISDSSKEIEVEKALTFAIALDENPSTGYLWHIKESDNFEVVGDGFIDVKTEELLVGAGGTHYYGIKPLIEGKITVEFELIAPSSDVEDTIIFTVNSK